MQAFIAVCFPGKSRLCGRGLFPPPSLCRWPPPWGRGGRAGLAAGRATPQTLYRPCVLTGLGEDPPPPDRHPTSQLSMKGWGGQSGTCPLADWAAAGRAGPPHPPFGGRLQAHGSGDAATGKEGGHFGQLVGIPLDTLDPGTRPCLDGPSGSGLREHTGYVVHNGGLWGCGLPGRFGNRGSEFQECPQSGQALWTNSGELIGTVVWDGATWREQRGPPDGHTPAVTSGPEVWGAVGS